MVNKKKREALTVTRLIKELDLDKQYVTKIMGQMVSKKQIKAKPNGRLEIVKGD